MHTGLAADELYSTDGFANRWALDRRVFSYEKSNSESDCSFEFLQRARAEALSAADLFSQTAQRNSPRHGDLYLIAGFSTLMLAENFCSGVPLSRVASDGTFQYGEPLPTAQVYAVPPKDFGAVEGWRFHLSLSVPGDRRLGGAYRWSAGSPLVLGYRFWAESFRECSACVSTSGTEGATPTGFIPLPEVAQRAANYRSLDARLDCVHRMPKQDAIEFLQLHNLFGWIGSVAYSETDVTLEGTCRLPMYAPSCCESKRPGPAFAGAVGIRLAF